MSLGVGELAAAGSALLWAIAVIFFKRAGEQVTPIALNLFKNALATPLIVITAYLFGAPLLTGLDGALMGLLAVSTLLGMVVGDTLTLASLNRLGAGWTAVVSALWPPMMILVTAVGFGEPVTPTVGVGTVLIVAAVLLTAEGRGDGHHDRKDVLIGVAMGAGAHLTMAMGIAVLKYPILGRAAVFETHDALFVSAWRIVMGTAMLILWMTLSPGRRRQVALVARPSPLWWTMAPGALFGTWLAVIAWMVGMREISGSLVRAAILNQTIVIYLPILGRIFLHEPLTPRKGAAIALAFGGACVVTLAQG